MPDAPNRTLVTMLSLLLAPACGTPSPGNPDAGAGDAMPSDDARGGGDGASIADVPPADVGPLPGDAGTLSVATEPNRDSAILRVSPFAGAREYRAFALPAGAVVSTDAQGRETVTGTVIHCGGFEQHNAPATPTPVPIPAIEVTDLHGANTYVVEAIDRACPFPGAVGIRHSDFVYEAPDQRPADETLPFSFFTEDEIRARYGSLIVNGQGPGPHPSQPADPDPPVVLARATITVAPARGAAPTATFFDDFDPPEQPGMVQTFHLGSGRGYMAQSSRNSKWNFFQYNTQSVEGDRDVTPAAQIFVDRGQLHVLLPDWSQDVMGSVVAIPRTLAHVSDTAYLHVTYEVALDATNRRYPWITVCGAGAPGQTLDAAGNPASQVQVLPGFFNADGVTPTIDGWNCFQMLSRGGIPDEVAGVTGRNQTNLRMLVNRAVQSDAARGDLGIDRSNVVEISPVQINANWGPDWLRQMQNGAFTGPPVLDDQLRFAPRTRMDLYLRRDRAVLYVNGEQRVCNDFPSTPLTITEAMVSFGQVLYHTGAERGELQTEYIAGWTDNGQLQVLHNTPWFDARTWDNLGFEDGVASPPSFRAADCYVAQP